MSDLTAGIFGLAGAAIGGAATFAGTVWEQHRQARTARDERRGEAARAGVDMAMDELLEIQKLLRAIGRRRALAGEDELPPGALKTPLGAAFQESGISDEEQEERHQLMLDREQRITKAIHRVPDAELAERVIADTAIIYALPSLGETAHSRNLAVCSDAMRCLGAYLRGERLPSPNATVAEAHEHWTQLVREMTA